MGCAFGMTRAVTASARGRFHALRHTRSSRAAEMGVPEHVRRDIVGHSSRSMTGDYTHTSPKEMERALELVADFTSGSVSNLGKRRGRRGDLVRGGLVTR